MWRNWQTRQTQNLLVAIPCGFKSHLQHQRPGAPGAAADTCEAHGPRGLGRTQHKHLPLKTAFSGYVQSGYTEVFGAIFLRRVVAIGV